jgi:adenylate kinase
LGAQAGGRPRVLITGTPGVGKTTQCRKLARRISARCLSLGELLAGTPYVRYLPELDTHEIVDASGARQFVLSRVADGDVVDTHVVELSPDPEVVVVLRKAPDILYSELVARGWPLRKVVENVWAEILDVIYVEARRRWRDGVVQVDVSKRDPDETLEIIVACVVGGRCVNEEVDWLGHAERSGFLDFISRLERQSGAQ